MPLKKISVRPNNWDDVPLVLSTTEAAVVLNVHLNTIKNMIRDGQLPATRLGKTWRIEKSNLRGLWTAAPPSSDAGGG